MRVESSWSDITHKKPLVQFLTGDIRQKLKKKAIKTYVDWKGRYKTVIICTYYDYLYRKLPIQITDELQVNGFNC